MLGWAPTEPSGLRKWALYPAGLERERGGRGRQVSRCDMQRLTLLLLALKLEEGGHGPKNVGETSQLEKSRKWFLPPGWCARCQPSEVSLLKPIADLQGDNCVFEATVLVVIVLTEIET